MTLFSVPANLAFDTYGELIDGLNDWLNRSDLTGAAPQMIALAEARMRRKLAPVFNETTAVLAVVDGVVALPSDCGEIFRVIYDHDTLPRYSGLNVSDLDYDTSATKPYCYTIEGTNLRVWPSCDVALTVVYQQTFPALSEENPTNLFLASHPDTYFFGAMMFAEGYLANDARAANFKALFDEALDETVEYMSRQRFTGPLAPRLRREF